MDNNIGGSTPTSLRRSCPFADINNASAGDSPKKRNNIGVFTPTSLTKSTPFADITNASAGESRINNGSDRCTSSNVPQKENMQNLQEDGAKLSALELRRKRARERYASMSPKKKEARKMKARVYKQLKEDEYSAPLGDITNVSIDDLRRCHVNDCSTLQQGSNHALLQSVDRTGPGSDQQHMITPRRLPFTVINNVAHYDNMDHTGSPFSCILQGATQNSHTLPANTAVNITFLVCLFSCICLHPLLPRVVQDEAIHCYEQIQDEGLTCLQRVLSVV
ncbi:uncharacterized protein LOC127769972 isoform X3 [Oryza glaberrima]|uniref:uncharacterized protein LOC127769972 isoform X3 n=1 Tax=Oryza glaberrima TaxID=4538 RepID=UPI00224C61A0|nr:uncharacterized protein LOC127769972 isoform X3 [Oryza glaberrima]